ncbi:uncharacterized protein LOC126836139 [Adelges cooleyi]|uniref:uncharacterized protein LOC126836139 n=1 Tax=Adelges cooleyi TaxID=133065 RepID=UPI0021809081|nr:uncharacterized protein LOC126836139 [Adelges cooleyi]XP_050425249.1 uncharacterized protein LOC126836139 [Adelges cooleyi]XP_050425259.1 uncharacterized protein LOC126836139 [Adelges cooleyi]
MNSPRFWEPFVSFNSIDTIWENQPTYFVVQILFFVGAIVSLTHAFIHKGRRPILWVCILCHGLVIECVSYGVPEIDNFWHSQAPIMFLNQRLPVHIILVYPVFYYTAIAIACRRNTTKIGLMLSVGLNVLAIDLPYDIMGIKFIHWTWHDTDPNIRDRTFWVPWTSYYFHLTFSASFVFWFFNKEADLDEPTTITKETKTFLKSTFLSFPSGVLCFSVLYHPLHDSFHVSSQSIVLLLLALYGITIKITDSFKYGKKPKKNDKLLIIHVYLIIYYTIFLLLALVGKPEDEISNGIHEEIGPCNITVAAYGTDMTKRKYLCIQDYNEDFDFHCVKEIPAFSKIYTICGTAFENRAEYVIIISTVTMVAFIQFYKPPIINKITKKLL